MNQNDLSDRTLPLVKVECVLKTTDRAPNLPVNNFYGRKHHCFQMIFFKMISPLKFNRQGQVTEPQSRVALPIMIIGPNCMVELDNSPGNQRNLSDKSTVHEKPSWLSAVSS